MRHQHSNQMAPVMTRAALPIVMALAVSATTYAQAADNAADPVYNNGWQTSDNGGYGWQPWSVSGQGITLGDSNTNGSGGGPGINTAGRAWALGHTSTSDYATRQLQTAMAVNDVMGMAIDAAPGGINSLDFRLMSGSSNIFSLHFMPSMIGYSDNTGFHVVSSTLADSGYKFSFTNQGGGNYGASLNQLGTINTTVWSGSIPNVPITGIGVQVFSSSLNPADKHFINSMDVVPEPATVVALGTGLAAILKRRRQRMSA